MGNHAWCSSCTLFFREALIKSFASSLCQASRFFKKSLLGCTAFMAFLTVFPIFFFHPPFSGNGQTQLALRQPSAAA
jgi:hypothetical protein